LARTRIVLIDMAPLLREIVREAIVREPDLDIVAEHEEIDVRAAVELDDPDFIIVGENAAAQQDVRTLVGARRGLRALEVHSDGRESVLYELRPHRISLGEVSSDTLVRAIRAVPTWDAKT
jgi:DNA-binding NarL/FixJ family response regulator